MIKISQSKEEINNNNKKRTIEYVYKTPTHALYVQHYIILTC